LSHVGASALVVAPFLALELALGALPVAALTTWRRRRRARRGQQAQPARPPELGQPAQPAQSAAQEG